VGPMQGYYLGVHAIKTLYRSLGIKCPQFGEVFSSIPISMISSMSCLWHYSCHYY